MPKEFSSSLLDVHVHALRFFQIPVVNPRRDHAETAKLSSVFMRYQVVGIVGTEADLWEWPLCLAFKQFACQHTTPAIRRSRNSTQHLVDIILSQRPLATGSTVRDLDLLSDL